LPVTLPPGASLPIALAYHAPVAGTETADLVLEGPDGERATIPLIGQAVASTWTTDTWTVERMPGLDLLVVVDNGVGMAAEQARVLAALGPLPDVLRGRFDYHLAVTTSSLAPSTSCGGPAGGGERGRFVPIDGSRPRVVTPETPDPRAVWEANLAVGACHDGPNQALEAGATVWEARGSAPGTFDRVCFALAHEPDGSATVEAEFAACPVPW
jgi:hypothetical protein